MENTLCFTKKQFNAIFDNYKDLLKQKKDSKEITEKQYNDIISGIKEYDSAEKQSEEIINLSIDTWNKVYDFLSKPIVQTIIKSFTIRMNFYEKYVFEYLPCIEEFETWYQKMITI